MLRGFMASKGDSYVSSATPRSTLERPWQRPSQRKLRVSQRDWQLTETVELTAQIWGTRTSSSMAAMAADARL
eukprot:4132005-Prorocentrum_lima.AAC.1